MSRFLNGLLDIFQNLVDCEIILLQLGSFCQEEGNTYSHRLKSRFHEVFHIPLARTLIEANNIYNNVANVASLDVLAITDIGMTITSYWVSSWKFAPVQILLWGHPVTSGFEPGIMDYYIMPGDAVPDLEYGNMFTEQLVRFDSLAVSFPSVGVDDSKIQENENTLAKSDNLDFLQFDKIRDLSTVSKFSIRQYLTEKYGLRFPIGGNEESMAYGPQFLFEHRSLVDFQIGNEAFIGPGARFLFGNRSLAIFK